jgi:hypothetical protein
MNTRILFALMGCVLLAFGAAYADQGASAAAHVYLQVDPNISMGAVDAVIDGGTVQMGNIAIPLIFRIDANTEAVALTAQVTPLFKGNDPQGQEVLPININLSSGVVMDPDAANRMGGYVPGPVTAAYVADAVYTAADGSEWPAQETETIEFESSQNGHFSQNVGIKPTWNQADPEKPMGEYSGFVILLGSVLM